jgi:hypothetical protein
MGEVWATKHSDVLFRSDSPYTKLWRSRLLAAAPLKHVMTSFMEFCAADALSLTETVSVMPQETQSEGMKKIGLARNSSKTLQMIDRAVSSSSQRTVAINRRSVDDIRKIPHIGVTRKAAVPPTESADEAGEEERAKERVKRERKQVEMVERHTDLLMECLLSSIDRFPECLFQHSRDLRHLLLFRFGESCEKRFYQGIDSSLGTHSSNSSLVSSLCPFRSVLPPLHLPCPLSP